MGIELNSNRTNRTRTHILGRTEPNKNPAVWVLKSSRNWLNAIYLHDWLAYSLSDVMHNIAYLSLTPLLLQVFRWTFKFLSDQHIRCESKCPFWDFLTLFPKRLRIFSPNFTRLLHVPTYARLQIFIQLPPSSHHIKMSTIGRYARWVIALGMTSSQLEIIE